jgi:hypothetical protein
MIDLEARRQIAAERYALAAHELVASTVELAALDAAASNTLVGGSGDHRGFAGQPSVLAHPLALPDVATLHHDYAGRVAQRRDQLLAEATAG